MSTFVETNRDWMTAAACTSTDPEIFFPTTGSPGLRAYQICGGCPVRQRCADYADATHATFGIWGGLNTEQRYRRARRRQQAAP